jgi:hypothetical protein
MTRRVLLFVLAAMLSACDPFAEPGSMLDTYTTRLAYVLEAEIDARQAMTLETFPRLRDRRIKIEQQDISMLAFLSLYGCELQVVVAERNSILGRVMTPLNELRYQLRFIDKAQACLPMLDDDALITQLKQAIDHKRDTLPAYFWNAIWADEPMAAMLSRSNGVYETDRLSQVTELAQQLDTVISLSEQLHHISDETEFAGLGAMQQSWLFNPVPGQLLNSARLLIRELDYGSALMEQRITHKPLCYLHKPNARSEQLKGLFFSVYIGRVQPYLAKTSQAGQQLFSRMQQLVEQQKTVMPDSFQSYYRNALHVDREGSVWQQLDSAIKRHTEQWQRLFLQCGMQPMAG